MSPAIFFEDVVIGERLSAGPYRVPADEMIGFARTWDALPHHVDEAAAKAAGFAGIVAPGLYMLAVKMRLLQHLPFADSVIASFGYDELRFLAPVRPGDELSLELLWVEKRRSQSKPDRGIVKQRFTLLNQHGAPAMRHLDTVLMRLRQPPTA